MRHDPNLRAPPRGSDAASARYIAAPIGLEEERPPALARWTIYLTALAVTGFLTWAALTPIKEITIAPGEVLPEGFVQQVQHLEGGRVSEILVADGDRVARGDLLMRFDAAALEAERREVEARRAAMALAIERLESFAAGEGAAFPDLGPAFETQTSTQRAMLDAQIGARAARLDGALAELDQAREANRSARYTLVKLREERAVVEEMLARRTPLLERGFVRLPEYEAIQRDALRLDREIGAARSEATAAALRIDAASAHRDELVAELRRAALDESAKAQVELAAAEAMLARLQDRIDNLALRAPVAGVVQRVALRAPGAIAQPGEPLVEIVPVDDEIYAEVRVPPAEIGYIAPGLPAVVKVTTYDFVRFGGVQGEVARVSPGTEIDQRTGEPFFRVRVRLAKDHVGGAASGMPVAPGMEIIADIKTGEKSVLRYLFKPIRAAFDRALTER
jgi:adhesin transport system membrane fusion protein